MIDLLILKMLKSGEKNAISRKDLVRSLKTSDRVIREVITSLTDQGYPIISNTKTGGYYYPESVEECERYIKMLNSYIRSFAIRKRNLELWVKQNPHKHEQLGLNL